MDAAELLEKTADVIEERGHAKFALERPDGSVCLLGGMNVVQGGCADSFVVGTRRAADTRGNALRALTAYLGLEPVSFCVQGCCPATSESAAVDWNNADEREPSEVIDACRHAAKVLRGG